MAPLAPLFPPPMYVVEVAITKACSLYPVNKQCGDGIFCS